jgi:hypothetical protein
MLKSGKEYLQSLNDGRVVRVAGSNLSRSRRCGMS